MKRLVCCVLAALLLAGCAATPPQETTTQTTEKRDDGIMNILLIGNSACYYWTDELWGMLDAAGYQDVNIYNLYYDGASLQQHYTWWKNNELTCELFCVNSQGRNSLNLVRLADVLAMKDWDYITFLQASRYYRGSLESAKESITPYLGELLELTREKAPNATLFWQETWALAIGYDRSGVVMDSLEKQEAVASVSRQVSAWVAETYGLTAVPLGSIWQSVRNDPLFAQPGDYSGLEKFTLCTRIRSGQIIDDFQHDGDIGGGQYLNACAYYEAITGQDCRENTFRPRYMYVNLDCSLTEDEVSALQNAAHAAGK